MANVNPTDYQLTDDEAEKFFQAYVNCALWSSTDDDEPLDGLYSPDDIADDALRAMRADCEDFIGSEDSETMSALRTYVSEFGAERAGHDFWLTRNGHGTGFWDRHYVDDDLGRACQHLTAMAKPYGEATLYVGDDGLLYVS
jgi:hypothetical protein